MTEPYSAARIQHLQMIQAVIQRMAGNSFALKAWSVTLVAGVFALSDRAVDLSFGFIAYLPALLFWVLDGYFLATEQQFRKLYDDVRKASGEPDFLLTPKQASAGDITKACLSKTILWFYLTLLVAVLAVIAVSARSINPSGIQ